MAWLPLHLRNRPDNAREYQVLVDGVPDWLEPSLSKWVADRAAEGGNGLSLRAEQLLRRRFPVTNGQYRLLAYWQRADDESRLALIDFLLHEWEELHSATRGNYIAQMAAEEYANAARDLASILTDGGSLWRFESDPHWQLVRRVSETSQDQYDSALDSRSDASESLRAAWTACYRQNPNYDEAYRKAILAVEAVVLPLAIPSDRKGTLGKAIRHMKDTRSSWAVGELAGLEPTGADVLIDMLDLMWINQQRHARRDGSIADVTQGEAEAVLGIAVTVLQWFQEGLVRRT